jgi:hypothetical protein
MELGGNLVCGFFPLLLET